MLVSLFLLTIMLFLAVYLLLWVVCGCSLMRNTHPSILLCFNNNLYGQNYHHHHSTNNSNRRTLNWAHRHTLHSWAINSYSKCSNLNGTVSSCRLKPKRYCSNICKVCPTLIVVGFLVGLACKVVREMLIASSWDHPRSLILCMMGSSSNLWAKQVLAVVNNHSSHRSSNSSNSNSRHSMCRLWLRPSQR